MLAFLEHLADRAEGVPLMIVGTTRPELYEQHADFGNGLRNTTAINLAPLSSKETARLVSALLDTQRDPGRAATADPRAGRREPAVCRGVRPAREGQGLAGAQGVELGAAGGCRGAVPRLGQGTDRGAFGHAHARCEVAAGGRGGDRQGVLGRRRRRRWASAIPTRWRKCCVTCHERSWSVPRAARRCRARPSTRSGTSSPETSPTANCHAPRAPPATSPPPPGSKRRPPTASKIWRTSSPTTTRPPWNWPAPPARRIRWPTLEEPARRFLTLAGERALGLDTAAATHQPRAGTGTHPRGPRRPRTTCLVSFAEAALHGGRTGEARAALEEAIPALQALGDLPGPGPRHEHAQCRAARPRRIRAGRSCPPRRSHCWNHSRPTGTWSQPSPRWPRGDAPGPVRVGNHRCSPRAEAGGGARPRPPAARARLPRLVARWTSETPPEPRICAKRSCLRIRPDRAAKSPSCTTTSAPGYGPLRAPRPHSPNSPPASRMPPPAD